jgi:hypothetical protein
MKIIWLLIQKMGPDPDSRRLMRSIARKRWLSNGTETVNYPVFVNVMLLLFFVFEFLAYPAGCGYLILKLIAYISRDALNK